MVETVRPHTHFQSYSEARARFKDLLDAAASGRPATVEREHRRAAIVDADRLRSALAATRSGCVVVAEAKGWSVFIPGLAVAADGTTFDEALDEMVVALREYVLDWEDRLSRAPNHANNWALVQLVTLSTDEQLVEWLTAA